MKKYEDSHRKTYILPLLFYYWNQKFQLNQETSFRLFLWSMWKLIGIKESLTFNCSAFFTFPSLSHRQFINTLHWVFVHRRGYIAHYSFLVVCGIFTKPIKNLKGYKFIKPCQNLKKNYLCFTFESLFLLFSSCDRFKKFCFSYAIVKVKLEWHPQFNK